MSRARDFADLASTSSVSSLSSRNLIINGALTVWQRSTSSTSTGWGYYTADRWNTNLRDGAGTMSQYDMGSELQPFIYAFKTAMTSAATTSPVVQQKIEDSRRFKNQTVTFSFYAKASKAITVDTQFDLVWANSSNATTAQSNSITTSWQRFTYTVTLPNPSGSYNATYDHLYCKFILPISDTYDFYITGIQLELGSTATNFEHRSYGEELAACQRYYWQLSQSVHGSYPSWIATAYSTTQMNIQIPFPVTMRSIPTMTYNTGNVNYYRFYRNSSNHNFGTVGTDTVTSEHINLYGTATSSHTEGTSGALQIRLADGAGVFASAEL